MHDARWQITGYKAELSCGQLAAELDLRRPDRGISLLTLHGRPVAGCHILHVKIPGVEGMSSSVDLYQRGTDVVAMYPATEFWPFRTQLYWQIRRSASVPAAVMVELMVSVQTSLLDSQPRLLAGSTLAICDSLQLEDPSGNPCSCTLVRLPDDLGSYVEMVHPLDFDGSEVKRLGAPAAGNASLLSLRHTLFGEKLEKGVILRSRVLAAFIARENDVEHALSLYREFAESEPPLTT